MKNYAIIENGVVNNIIVADADFAASIRAVEIPDGYGVGDSFDGADWHKAIEPEAPPDLPPAPSLSESQLLKAQLQAVSERQDFVEDCIAEMAMLIYGE